ncbi:DUF6886 family protein [Paenibacillus koleovorans]|uniref:DUF6886 family protein n=1 Tax=Paenibacillus koleovorans TaxID=121608 RepID=UPI001FE3E615|nr:DUF6886 family protein [Paenibacillus koleovorans]
MPPKIVYHFSEDPSIATFEPRRPRAYPDMPPVVWALDQEHAVHYYFPRDCPRVIYTKSEDASPADIARFFDGSTADKIIAVESRWLERIRSVRLYAYAFDGALFDPADGTAGYYVSHRTVTPLGVEPVGDLLERIASTGTELRLTPSLVPLRDAVIASTLKFSVIRYSNAVK